MRAFVIHLASAVEREPLIEELRKRMPVEIWEGLPGGNVGCTGAHLALYRKMLDEGEKEWIVFEDDCEFIGHPFLGKGIAENCDIWLFGANEYVNSEIQEDARRVYRFWGTHAMLMTAYAAQAILYAAEECKPETPMDWLVSYAIATRRLRVFGPVRPEAHCRQKNGLVSLITGNERISRVEKNEN